MLGQLDENHRAFTPLTVTNQDQLSARLKAFAPSDLKGKKRRQAMPASVGGGDLSGFCLINLENSAWVPL